MHCQLQNLRLTSASNLAPGDLAKLTDEKEGSLILRLGDGPQGDARFLLLDGSEPFVIYEWPDPPMTFRICGCSDLRMRFGGTGDTGRYDKPGTLVLVEDGAFISARLAGRRSDCAKIDLNSFEPFRGSVRSRSAYSDWEFGRLDESGVFESLFERKL